MIKFSTYFPAIVCFFSQWLLVPANSFRTFLQPNTDIFLNLSPASPRWLPNPDVAATGVTPVTHCSKLIKFALDFG